MASRKAVQTSLSLERAMLYDNIITASLVDQVHFCGSTRKFSGRYFETCQRTQQQKVRRIITSQIVSKSDVKEAVRQFCDLQGMMDAIPEHVEYRDHFRQHLQRYASIYMSDCPFIVTATDRYRSDISQSSVTARRDIEACKTIKYLAGVQIMVNEKQEEDLVAADNDFSLVVSSRRNTCSLLLGPVRFANHDCNANARLAAVGRAGVQVISVNPIRRGDEITVSYGDDYFGKDNKECLCFTCEQLERNGWALSGSKNASHDTDPICWTSNVRLTRSMRRSRIMPNAAE